MGKFMNILMYILIVAMAALFIEEGNFLAAIWMFNTALIFTLFLFADKAYRKWRDIAFEEFKVSKAMSLQTRELIDLIPEDKREEAAKIMAKATDKLREIYGEEEDDVS